MNVENKNIVVVGMAKSGLSAAKLLKKKGANVFVTDSKSCQELRTSVQELKSAGIQHECGKHSLSLQNDCDFIVLSPGVPETIALVQKAINKGVPYFSEIEVASWYCDSPIIGITGSNGKTTTTSLIGDLVKTEFPGSFVGGNIGTPFSDSIDNLDEQSLAVLELSSFQLLNTKSFHPHIAVLLNFSPDHLDRHKTYASYIYAKRNIFKNQNSKDFIIYNADDPLVVESAMKSSAQKLSFSASNVKSHLFIQGPFLYSRLNGGVEKIVDFKDIKLKGIHNYMNIAAAVAAALCLGINVQNICNALKSFSPIEHRLEFVKEISGIKYYNDSKATNSDATKQALLSFDGPIVLLAGGYAKEFDYSHLTELVHNRTRIICLFGKDRKKLLLDLNLSKTKNTFLYESLEEAFSYVSQIAEPGDNVLLSPMCASFDQYSSFEERGLHFKKLVNNLR